MKGSFNPIFSLNASTAALGAFSPNINCAGSPGVTYIIANTNREIPNNTGIKSNNLLITYLYISHSPLFLTFYKERARSFLALTTTVFLV